jgi:deoxyribodipyrimidine photolyase-related protein
MVERIVYVPFDHLSFDHGALAGADPRATVIAMVESERMLTGRPWHKERLFFLASSARHFAADAESRGFTVRYLQAPTTVAGLQKVRDELPGLPMVCAEPSSYRQFAALAEFGLEFVENDFFLTSRDLFQLWATRQKSFVMENFYRAQRVRLGILVDDDGKPEAGRWNFDAENRLPPPKTYDWPPYLEHDRDEIDEEVAEQLGHTLTTTWATTRAGALAQLSHFIERNLAGFGPYEDAI